MEIDKHVERWLDIQEQYVQIAWLKTYVGSGVIVFMLAIALVVILAIFWSSRSV